jgi:3-phenylpropionate/trans-cinnamate dioxygenase ferredoxin subunit
MVHTDPTTQFVKVLTDSAVAEGQVVVIEARGKRIAVCRCEGLLYAIDDRCTHDNGPLGEGELVDCQIECPRHGARFDIKTGKALCFPGVGAVRTYEVDVREGDIWIGFPAGLN